MKHNNAIPNAHFHYDWQRFVKTWFNQPAKKVKRRALRLAKAKAVAPRPLHSLRPFVRGQTVKYNSKLRAGRGFTSDELKAAGINRKEARGLGISIDKRRKNRSEESLTLNAQRLKQYRSKVILFPRKNSSKRVKKGEATKEQQKQAGPQKLAIDRPQPEKPKIKPRKATKEEKEATVTAVLRKALTDSKLWGQRAKRVQRKADEASGKAKKAAKQEDAGGDMDE